MKVFKLIRELKDGSHGRNDASAAGARKTCHVAFPGELKTSVVLRGWQELLWGES